MKKQNRILLLAAAALLAACAMRDPPPASEAPPPRETLPKRSATSPPPADEAGVIRLRCDDGLQLRLRVLQDEVQVDGLPGGREVLLRDAGGVTPQQSVFSNARARAEFGLGAQASEAVVHLLQPQPRDLHCRPA
ncbi:hypothetical protein [Ramlibacter humi]|uniref:C-type lysozyme inhibitor domain-containing protein n=1 Tax=Ramlibacter humi TaxID=2530451 RepID=A0A4Z0BU53_9BURK|nr:hypothetical protein [Ramlibacter humi]TFZ02004.1 hypothetical protein EZ216_12570 [Ramlibacter humi]